MSISCFVAPPPQVNYDDNNPFSEGFQERERRERLWEQQERQRVQLLQEVRHPTVVMLTRPGPGEPGPAHQTRARLTCSSLCPVRWSVSGPCSREWSWSSRLSSGPQGPLGLQ